MYGNVLIFTNLLQSQIWTQCLFANICQLYCARKDAWPRAAFITTSTAVLNKRI